MSIGTDQREGIITLFVGLLIAGLAIYSLISRKGWLRPLLLLAACGSLVLIVLTAIDITRAAEAWQVSPIEFSGLGIAIVLVGALVATGAGVANLRSRRR
ncbi:hypothetical protein JW848_01325 [Candidatus Bipolaricaulota bacterium]|nr:hypothetical protein [Candidatus Bipolaricaulota bacterium]